MSYLTQNTKRKAKQLIEDRERRRNLKSKRKRNLFKKAIELSQMCNMKVLILVHDTDTDKISQYSSGGLDGLNEIYSVERAVTEYVRLQKLDGKIKIFNDKDYDELKIIYRRATQN